MLFRSLLFNMLSRLVITFLPRSKYLLISWLQSPSAVILEPPKIKSALFPLFPHLFATLEATQGAPRYPRRDSGGERSPLLPLEARSDSPGAISHEVMGPDAMILVF